MTIMCAHSGRQIDIEAPQPESLDIGDIAHALSFICRGSGQVNTFFSVAQHCICCAREAAARGYSTAVQLACLLHDASEAYMMDLPKPIKDNLLPGYRVYEDALLACIYRRFLSRELTPEESRRVDEMDHLLLQCDLKYLLNRDIPAPELLVPPDYTVRPFEEVREEYLDLFRELAAAL